MPLACVQCILRIHFLNFIHIGNMTQIKFIQWIVLWQSMVNQLLFTSNTDYNNKYTTPFGICLFLVCFHSVFVSVSVLLFPQLNYNFKLFSCGREHGICHQNTKYRSSKTLHFKEGKHRKKNIIRKPMSGVHAFRLCFVPTWNTRNIVQNVLFFLLNRYLFTNLCVIFVHG